MDAICTYWAPRDEVFGSSASAGAAWCRVQQPQNYTPWGYVSRGLLVLPVRLVVLACGADQGLASLAGVSPKMITTFTSVCINSTDEEGEVS